jgi:hypothetical protein
LSARNPSRGGRWSPRLGFLALEILKALVTDGRKKIAAGAEQNVVRVDVRRTNFRANKVSRRPPPEQLVEKVQ